tara:strand:- start:13602 stop:13760 length:159 start_codon:yes stop_codon:yes gene_type:complete
MSLQDIYVRRMLALQRAAERARDPEFRKMWKRKLKEFIKKHKKILDKHGKIQ